MQERLDGRMKRWNGYEGIRSMVWWYKGGCDHAVTRGSFVAVSDLFDCLQDALHELRRPSLLIRRDFIQHIEEWLDEGMPTQLTEVGREKNRQLRGSGDRTGNIGSGDRRNRHRTVK